MFLYKGRLDVALKTLFPHINFDSSKFPRRQKWGTKEDRRKFFEKFAKANQFDPLIAGNWFPHRTVARKSNAIRVILTYYKNNSYALALCDLFGFDLSDFKTKQIIWRKAHKIRKPRKTVKILET